MPVHFIPTLDDPRLEPYRHLKKTNQTRWSRQFVAEGKRLVQRLLETALPVRSLLVAEHRFAEAESWIPESVETYLIPESLARQLVGFNFHAGFMACGERPPPVDVRSWLDGRGQSSPLTVVVCPNVNDPENLGAMIRLSACFGVDLLMLGHGCCDPFSRRVLRVSMGNGFHLPICESRDLIGDLDDLAGTGCERVATVLDPTAEPLSTSGRSRRLALLFGNEAEGLSLDWIQRCERRVTIPMAAGADSLNVAVAAGIILHHFTRAVGFAADR